jgi:hypothetical protein
MWINKVIGLLLLIVGFFVLREGVKFKKNDPLNYIPNVRLIGAAALLFILGISFLISKKYIF